MDFAAEKGAETAVESVETKNAHAVRLLSWCDRNRRLLLVSIVILYAAAFTGRWRINPDSAIYMSLGRNLAEGNGYTYLGERHTRYEPGLPWVISACDRMFGSNHYAPILLFVLACSVTSLLLTYRLMLLHAGRPTAVLVATGVAICETCFRYGFQIVTDTPFLAGVMTYLLAYECLIGAGQSNNSKKWTHWASWIAIPISTFCMTAFRPTSLTFVGAVGIACVWNLIRRKPLAARHIVIGILTLAAFWSFRYVDPRRATAGTEVKREQRLKSLLTEQRSYFMHRMARKSVDFAEKIVPRAIFGTEVLPGVNTGISLAIILASVSLWKRRALWGAFCLGTFLQCMTWLPRERYLLAILPLIVFGLWRGVLWLSARTRSVPVASMLSFVVPVSLFAILNVGYDLHFIVEQRRVGIDPRGAIAPDDAVILEMAQDIARDVGDDAVVFAAAHDELAYFSRKRVDQTPWSGAFPPTKAELADFFERAKTLKVIYAVLPDPKDETHLKDLVDQLNMQPGAPIAIVEQPRDRKGNAVPPLVLYRLEPKTMMATPK